METSKAIKACALKLNVPVLDVFNPNGTQLMKFSCNKCKSCTYVLSTEMFLRTISTPCCGIGFFGLKYITLKTRAIMVRRRTVLLNVEHIKTEGLNAHALVHFRSPVHNQIFKTRIGNFLK